MENRRQGALVDWKIAVNFRVNVAHDEEGERCGNDFETCIQMASCSPETSARAIRTGVQVFLYCLIQKTASTCVVPKTVLIADDSASVRLSVRLLLQGRHKEIVVREAFDGMDAIEKAKKSKPDLILLDLAMPRVNGAEAAAVLKNEMPETPVILFTYTDLRIDSLCQAIGVDFISKVDGIPKLLERVDSLFPPN